MVTVADALTLAHTDSVVIDRPDRAVLRLRGADVRTYLHAVTSQHLADRRPGECAAALLLSAKGRIEFELRCTFLDKGALVDTDAEAAAALAERLRRFVFRYDVEVDEPVAGALTVAGPAAGDALARAGLAVPAQDPWSARVTGDGDLVAVRTTIGIDLVGLQTPAPAELGAAGLPVAPDGGWEALRIERGMPRWGRELTDDVLAEEAGLLASHVHLQKGCYPGQETVARVHNLGQLQRRLAGLRLSGPALVAPGAALETLAGARAGQVRSVARHPELGVIALAFVRRTVDAGDRVLAGGHPASVVDLPFRPAG